MAQQGFPAYHESLKVDLLPKVVVGILDKRADIWSWGVMLYELLTGERLFQGEDAAETLAAVIHKQPDLERQLHRLLNRPRACGLQGL